MRVLHVVPTYLPATRYGGPIYSVHGLCKALVEKGVEVHVFTTNVDGAGSSDVPIGEPVNVDGVNVWYFESTSLRRLYFSPTMKLALQKQVEQFDLIHIHSVFLYPTLIASRVAARAQRPYVISPRGMLVKELIQEKSPLVKTLWIKLFEKKNLRHASAIHLTSSSEEESLIELLPGLDQRWVVPNGIPEPVENNWVGSTEGNRVLFIGRINWKKGLERLIEAVHQGAPGEFTIAGNNEDGYQVKLQELIDRNELTSRFSFVGPVYGDEKDRLIKQSDLFVMPSLNENFGNSALEAIALGCPTLVTEGCGIVNNLQDTKAMRVIDGSVAQLKQALVEITQDSSLRCELSERGYAEAKSFAWPDIADRMIDQYRTLVNV